MISFVCECGAKFEIDDQHAGRTAKCRCGKKIVVPPPNMDAAPADPSPIAITPKSRPSGATIAANAPLASEVPVTPNPGPVRIQTAPPPSASKSRANTPRRRKQSRNAGVWVLLGVCCLLSVVVSIFYVYRNQSEQAATDSSTADSLQKPSLAQGGLKRESDDQLLPQFEDTVAMDAMTEQNRARQLDRGARPDVPQGAQNTRPAKVSWQSAVDPLVAGLHMPVGTSQVVGALSVVPTHGRDDFLVKSTVDVRNPDGHYETAVIDPRTLETQFSRRLQSSASHAGTDIAPDGNYFVRREGVGTGPDRPHVLRRFMLDGTVDSDIPITEDIYSLRTIDSDQVLVELKDNTLQLVDYASGRFHLITTFPGRQSVSWRVTPGKRFVILMIGTLHPVIRVVDLSDSSYAVRGEVKPSPDGNFVIHHATISPNGRYMALSLLNARADQKRVTMIDLESGETLADVATTELPEGAEFSSRPVAATDNGGWLFDNGLLVSAKTKTVDWRFTDVHPTIDPGILFYPIRDNRVLAIQAVRTQKHTWELVVSQLP